MAYHMNGGPRMTPDNVAKFATLYHAGASWVAIEAEIGIKEKSLRAYRARAGLPFRPQDDARLTRWTPKQDADLIKMQPTSGWKAIGEHLHKSVDSVIARARKLGLYDNAPPIVENGSDKNSPAYLRSQAGSEPLKPLHPIAVAVLMEAFPFQYSQGINT